MFFTESTITVCSLLDRYTPFKVKAVSKLLLKFVICSNFSSFVFSKMAEQPSIYNLQYPYLLLQLQ